jgi:hypothetical protein
VKILGTAFHQLRSLPIKKNGNIKYQTTVSPNRVTAHKLTLLTHNPYPHLRFVHVYSSGVVSGSTLVIFGADKAARGAPNRLQIPVRPTRTRC